MLDKVKKDLRQREFASNDDQTSSLCHKHGSIDASAIFFRLSVFFRPLDRGWLLDPVPSCRVVFVSTGDEAFLSVQL